MPRDGRSTTMAQQVPPRSGRASGRLIRAVRCSTVHSRAAGLVPVVCGWRRPYRLACPCSGYEAEDQSESKIVEHNPDEGRDKHKGSDTKSDSLLHVRESPVPRIGQETGRYKTRQALRSAAWISAAAAATGRERTVAWGSGADILHRTGIIGSAHPNVTSIHQDPAPATRHRSEQTFT